LIPSLVSPYAPVPSDASTTRLIFHCEVLCPSDDGPLVPLRFFFFPRTQWTVMSGLSFLRRPPGCCTADSLARVLFMRFLVPTPGSFFPLELPCFFPRFLSFWPHGRLGPSFFPQGHFCCHPRFVSPWTPVLEGRPFLGLSFRVFVSVVCVSVVS